MCECIAFAAASLVLCVFACLCLLRGARRSLTAVRDLRASSIRHHWGMSAAMGDHQHYKLLVVAVLGSPGTSSCRTVGLACVCRAVQGHRGSMVMCAGMLFALAPGRRVCACKQLEAFLFEEWMHRCAS